MNQYNDKRIIVAIPCRNEELTIQKVIEDFKKELPDAEVVVINNHSTDKSAEFAKDAGARVINELKIGKGWVIRTIFEKLDADICVIVDGDDTYSADEVHKLLLPVLEGRADMSVGSRLNDSKDKAFSPLHIFGNYAFTFLLNKLFKANFKDILSGFRVLSRDFINRVPLITGGFQTEAEMTIQAIEKKMSIVEIPINYRPRAEGSFSKVNTFKDGWLILLTMAMYMRDHNPLRFFLYLSIIWLSCSELLFGVILPARFNSTESVIIQGVIFIGTLLLFVSGMIMSAVNTRFRELEVIIRKLVKNENPE